MSEPGGSLAPLRIAVVAPRFHAGIVGGSEQYLRALCDALAARGAAVEVVTTASARVRYLGDDAVAWDDELTAEEPVASVRVERVTPRARSLRSVERSRRHLAASWRRAVEQFPASRQTAHLASGFFPLESDAEGRAFRWIGRRARIALGGAAWSSVRLELHAMHRVAVVGLSEGRECVRIHLEPHRWLAMEIPLLQQPATFVELLVSPVERAADGRDLGVAVGGVALERHGVEEQMNLSHDDAWLLAEMATSPLAGLLDARAGDLPWSAGLADARLKGPWSWRLARRALAAARRADVVLATNAPYATLALGWAAARLTGRPFVALPFLHLRDPAHHRPQVRGPLRRADLVLCLHEAARQFVESAWGARSALLGAAIDLRELAAPTISGERFRSLHGLADEAIVLQVSRKTPEKGYRLSAEAVARLRSRGMRVRFVHIGPDEDGHRLAMAGALWLGRRERHELLDALDACDVFALPSIHESFGLAYLEAWMRGRPVVGHARCDAARELIRPGESGELIDGLDDLTDRLEHLLTHTEYAASLGERGRQRAMEMGGWEAVADRAFEAIGALVGRREEA